MTAPTDDRDPTSLHLEELRFVEGARNTAFRGAILGIVAIGAVLAYLIYAYFYLSVTVGQWPPEGAPTLPVVGLLLVPFSLVVLSVAPTAVAWRAATRRHAVALAAAFGLIATLGAVVLGVGAAQLLSLDLEPTVRAYDASVVTLHAFHGVATAVGVVGAALVSYQAVRLGAQRWVTSAAAVVVAWWVYVVVGWVAVVAVVHGWPVLA